MNNKIINKVCCLFVMLFVCNYAFAYRPSAREKACFSNIRVIHCAVEMYNMDFEDMIKHIEPDTINTLIKGKYLKSEPSKPETTCEYKSIGDLTKDGKIFCKYHGDIEHLVDCECFQYDKYEKFSQNTSDDEFSRNLVRIKKGIEKYHKWNEVKRVLPYGIIGLGIPIVAIIYIISTILSGKKNK